MILVNQSTTPFPLELLRVDSNKGAIDGADWGVTNLESRMCVGAWREGAVHKLPNDSNCSQLVGIKIDFKKKNWFGTLSLDVSYDRQKVGTCDRNQTQCLITFRP